MKIHITPLKLTFDEMLTIVEILEEKIEDTIEKISYNMACYDEETANELSDYKALLESAKDKLEKNIYIERYNENNENN